MLAKKTKIVPIDSSQDSSRGSSTITVGALPLGRTDDNIQKITFKVSPKKGVSVYGLQRFPVTLYKDQWLTLINNIDTLKEFIKEHSNELAEKHQDETI